MAGFITQINELIYESDLVLEILDARFPQKTRNIQIEDKIKYKNKALVLVLNKADLVTKQQIEKSKEELIKNEKLRVVFVSAKEKKGMNLLKREIQMIKTQVKKETILVGMLGYPNSGKSTLINSLSGKGKGKVGTSKRAGFTRGLQKIKISDGIYLLDAPGIIPYDQRDEFELFLVGSKNANQLTDMETVAVKLVSELKEKIQKKFDLTTEDEDEILKQIAIKKNWLIRGGEGNIKRASREILEMYQRNEI